MSGLPPPGQTGRAPLAVYYGQDELATLSEYERVVVQPGHFDAGRVAGLQSKGVQVLAYLSLGEDDGGGGPWTRDQPQTNWHTRMVDTRSREWRERVRAQVSGAAPVFDGLFLDSVEHAQRDATQMQAMLSLIREVRRLVGSGYLLANRGLGLLSHLHGPSSNTAIENRAIENTVDGVLIEAFSSTWEDGYRAYSGHELEYTQNLLEQARALKLDVYALDYANTPELAGFARSRAEGFGIRTFISNRELTLAGGFSGWLAAQPT